METNQPNRHHRRNTRLNAPGRGTLYVSQRASSARPSLAATPPSTKFSWNKIRDQLSRVIGRLTSKQQRVTTGLVVVAVFALGAVIVFTQQQAFTKEESGSDQSKELIENIEYQTILPEGKSIDKLGGWKRVSPEGQTPVYAYVDKIGEASISVSQQPLPGSFIGKVDKEVAQLAKSYGATTELQADETKVYVGTSAKGPQSVILSKNSLLIMIKSQKQIDNSAWVEYIKGLN